MFRLKRLIPRGLYGRAALILIVPIVTIQLVVSTAFIQRHFEGVTKQMTQGVTLDLNLVLAEFDKGEDGADSLARANQVAAPLEITLTYPAHDLPPLKDQVAFYDLSGHAIIQSLREHIPQLIAADVNSSDRIVRLRLSTKQDDMIVEIARRRLAATNPHQLLVLMMVTSVLMTIVAYVFLRNQLRPISKLALAAEAFGRGEKHYYRPRGALEVRAAGRAFLEMRLKLERQIEQKMLMLSGVSHDLRTPLTRLKLALSFYPEDEEIRAMQADLRQMERLTDEFLAFVRGDATEEEEDVDLWHLIQEICADARRGGGEVTLLPELGEPRSAKIRPQAIRRGLENLISNALRYADIVEVSVIFRETSVVISVEDDGPGIPEIRREEALQPFTRLGAERDPNRGGGVGLGLSITNDIAASHGGTLKLGRSAKLGGLKASLEIAR